MLFEVAFEEWKIYASKRHKKQSFDTLINRFIKNVLPYFKGKDIYLLSKKDFINWQNIILSFNFSNSYNQFLYSVFNQFIKFCMLYFDLEHNFLLDIGSFPKHYESKKYDFYTYKEFKKFIQCVDHKVFKVYFSLLFFTGLRPSEAMALKFSDLRGFYLNIDKSIQRKGKRLLDSPKNNSSIRLIKIDFKLWFHLIKLRKVYDNCNDDFFIFGGLKPLSPTTIDRYKQKACNKCRLRCITQHQFRHSHATYLIEHNIPVNEVSRRLGHSKISTTLDIYTHNSLLHEKRVVAKLFLLRHF